AVNLLLVQEGLKPPPGALANPEFRGLSAEEIYPLIPPDTAERTLDRHLFDERAGAGAGAGARSAAVPASRDQSSQAAGAAGAEDGWDDAGDEQRPGLAAGADSSPAE